MTTICPCEEIVTATVDGFPQQQRPCWAGWAEMTHVWRWRRTRYGSLNDELQGRFGALCRVFARGLNGSVGVEFEDGYRVVAGSRYAIRRIA